jgi:hypothetical protein
MTQRSSGLVGFDDRRFRRRLCANDNSTGSAWNGFRDKLLHFRVKGKELQAPKRKTPPRQSGEGREMENESRALQALYEDPPHFFVTLL